MPRGGARRGAGRKALDQPEKPLLTYSLTLRLTDVGYLNQLRRGNRSLGLRRLIDIARLQLSRPQSDRSLRNFHRNPQPVCSLALLKHSRLPFRVTVREPGSMDNLVLNATNAAAWPSR